MSFMVLRPKWIPAAAVVVACAGSGGTDVTSQWGTPADNLRVWNGSLVLDVDYRLVTSRNLVASVTARNVGETGVSGEVNDCSLEMRAYPTEDRQGEPLWQGPGAGSMCLDFAMDIELPPGGTAWIGQVLVPYEALPTGTTYFSARIIFLRSAMRTEELPAGEVRK